MENSVMKKEKTSTNKSVIGVLTSFYNFDPGYSLCSVVREQLIALTKNKYKTVLFVLPSFEDDALVPKEVEIRKIVPQLILEPYKELNYPDHWKEDIKKAKEMFEKNMQDIDYLICHDIFFIDTFLPYNIALREANLKCKILAWTHSAPSARPVLENNPHANRYNLPLRTKLVYLNHEKANDLAEMYGAWLKDIRIVHNSRDPRTFWGLDPFVISLIDKYELLEKDIIAIYPLSTPRMISGKGLDKAIKIMSKLKELNYKVCLIVPNAHANNEKDKRLINETKFWANDRNINDQELIFTSLEEIPKYEMGVNPKIVSDLFRLSNIFLFPTLSENCSLVLLEAMLNGCLLVLNRNVVSLLEFGGQEALYFDFNYKEDKEDNERYYLDLAKIIASQFKNNKSLQTKRHAFQKHNYDYIFKRQIENLFFEDEN